MPSIAFSNCVSVMLALAALALLEAGLNYSIIARVNGYVVISVRGASAFIKENKKNIPNKKHPACYVHDDEVSRGVAMCRRIAALRLGDRKSIVKMRTKKFKMTLLTIFRLSVNMVKLNDSKQRLPLGRYSGKETI